MIPERRRHIFILLLALLLLGMQQEAYRHELTHVADLVNRPHAVGLQTPLADTPCFECALLSGGAHLVPSNASAFPHPVSRDELPGTTLAWRATAAPSYYLTRAPPVLL